LEFACSWYFSSPSCFNARAAKVVSTRIAEITAIGTGIDRVGENVIECKVPSQCNGYDCGIHTLATAEALSSAYEKLGTIFASWGPRNMKKDMRLCLEQIVEQFMENYESIGTMTKEKRLEIAKDIRRIALLS